MDSVVQTWYYVATNFVGTKADRKEERMPTPKKRKTLDGKLPEVRVPQAVRDVLDREAQSRIMYVSVGEVIKEAVTDYIEKNNLFEKHGIQRPE